MDPAKMAEAIRARSAVNLDENPSMAAPDWRPSSKRREYIQQWADQMAKLESLQGHPLASGMYGLTGNDTATGITAAMGDAAPLPGVIAAKMAIPKNVKADVRSMGRFRNEKVHDVLRQQKAEKDAIIKEAMEDLKSGKLPPEFIAQLEEKYPDQMKQLYDKIAAERTEQLGFAGPTHDFEKLSTYGQHDEVSSLRNAKAGVTYPYLDEVTGELFKTKEERDNRVLARETLGRGGYGKEANIQGQDMLSVNPHTMARDIHDQRREQGVFSPTDLEKEHYLKQTTTPFQELYEHSNKQPGLTMFTGLRAFEDDGTEVPAPWLATPRYDITPKNIVEHGIMNRPKAPVTDMAAALRKKAAGLQPSVRDPLTGESYIGLGHLDATEHLPPELLLRQMRNEPSEWEHGFTDENGKFYTYEEGMRIAKGVKPTLKEDPPKPGAEAPPKQEYYPDSRPRHNYRHPDGRVLPIIFDHDEDPPPTVSFTNKDGSQSTLKLVTTTFTDKDKPE